MSEEMRGLLEMRAGYLQEWRDAEGRDRDQREDAERWFYRASQEVADLVAKEQEAIAANLLLLEGLQPGDSIEIERWGCLWIRQGAPGHLRVDLSWHTTPMMLIQAMPLLRMAVMGGAKVVKAGALHPQDVKEDNR